MLIRVWCCKVLRAAELPSQKSTGLSSPQHTGAAESSQHLIISLLLQRLLSALGQVRLNKKVARMKKHMNQFGQ